MSKAALWSAMAVALVGAGSTIAAAYIGAQETAQSGQKSDLLQNIQVGFKVLVFSEQNTYVRQAITQSASQTSPRQSSPSDSGELSNPSFASTEQCDDARKRSDRGAIADLSGTKEVNFTIDASPCKRRINIAIWGEAISIAETGARTAEFVAKSGEKELCKASTSLASKKGTNVHFNTGWSRCEVLLDAFQSMNVQSFVSDINKAESSALTLRLSSVAI